MGFLIWVLYQLLQIYLWLIIITVMISWLVAFDVLNLRNRWVYKLCEWLNRLTDPLVRRIRRVVPPLGGMDVSPMVIMLGIYVLQNLLIWLGQRFA